MRDFDELLSIAAERKGSVENVLGSIDAPKTAEELAKITDDRWLSMMTKCVFRAGFSWKVIAHKWDGFEAAFEHFSIGRCSMMDDEWLDQLLSDKRIVRNGQKIMTVQKNASMIAHYSSQNSGFGKFIADWPVDDYINLITILKKEGGRLGGTTGQYFLRNMGKESFILTRDVTNRLIAEGVIDKPPTSKRAIAEVQKAFNIWREESGQSFNVISRVLAQTIG